MIIDIPAALQSLRPNAQWHMIGVDTLTFIGMMKLKRNQLSKKLIIKLKN